MDDLTEREALVEELASREDTASKQQDKDKETAEHISIFEIPPRSQLGPYHLSLTYHTTRN